MKLQQQAIGDKLGSNQTYILCHLSNKGLIVQINLQSPTNQEKAWFCSGRVQVKTFAVDIDSVPVCGILFRVGDSPWMDAPLNAAFQVEEALALICNPEWNLVQYTLCNDATITKLGIFGLWKHDADRLRVAFKRHLESPISKANWDKAVMRMNRQYTTLSLLAMSLAGAN